MDAQLIFFGLLGVLFFGFVFNAILDFLNQKYAPGSLPGEISDVFPDEEYQKSKAYQKANFRFSLVQSVFSFMLVVFVIAAGWLGALYDFLSLYFQSKIVLALVFFGVLFLVNDFLQLPFSYYHQFVLEEKFGFNKTTKRIFWTDKLKGYLLTCILGGGILALLLWLVFALGSSFWWVFWVCISLVMFVMQVLYVQVIAPMFNKFSPLEEGDLKSRIVAYSEKVSFPLKGIFIMDGSKRSSKANAYFTGFGRMKRIVLFDTLLEKLENEELVAVLAHEVGHYKKKHIVFSLILSVLQTGAVLYVLSLFVFNAELTLAMGSLAGNWAVPLNLIAFGILLEPLQMLLSVGFNMLSRKNEYEADAWASETFDGKALVRALKKLTVHNLGNLTPHPLYVFLHYSHPTLLQRIRALNKLY